MGCSGGTTCEVFVEATPEIQPNFNRGPNGVFVLQVPPICVNLSTTCNPHPPSGLGAQPFKPQESFVIQFPELQQIIFDPINRQPPNAMVEARVQKKGVVLEVPQQVGLNAQLKCNSPNGALVLEDLQVCGNMQQKVGEHTLQFKLVVEGQLVMTQGMAPGVQALEVDLDFHFVAQLQKGAHGPGGLNGSGSAAYGHGMLVAPQGGQYLAAPVSSFGIPAAPVSSFGALGTPVYSPSLGLPAQPISSFGAPAQPISSFAAPAAPVASFGSPQGLAPVGMAMGRVPSYNTPQF